MSSEAIARRLREVSELRRLGFSLARARRIDAPRGEPVPDEDESAPD